MKQTIFSFVIIILSFGCTKENFDVHDPDVEIFVSQLKNGTYDEYEINDDGEQLWTILPSFNKNHIPLLLERAKDTSMVTPCSHFPVNPVSSIRPYRISKNGKESIMIGEYLLWCVEAAINGHFVSLTPILTDEENPNRNLSGLEILEMRARYLNWWITYGKVGDEGVSPLNGTPYRWR